MNEEELILKYDYLIELIDYKNYLYYGALFRQLFSDFTIPNEKGSLDYSIEDLSKIIQKVCEKKEYSIHNFSMTQIIQLFGKIIEKLGGKKTLRSLNPFVMETLLYRMYSDEEMMTLIKELDRKNCETQFIQAFNSKNQIIFNNQKSPIQLPPSSKFSEFINLLMK